MGANSAGLLNKKESFERNLNLFLPGVFFVQETKLRRKNKIKHPNYLIFEYLRENNSGGGLLTAVHKSLLPVSVSNDTEEEVLVVEATIGEAKVRFINAYGPQEDDKDDIREGFFNRIDQEVKKSKLAGALVCLEMDANAKLGPGIIDGDPKEQSKNGKLLENVVTENDLVIVNAEKVCKGIITRYRKTINNEEKSILDYFLVCRRFYTIVKSMVIDEERKYALTKYSGRTGHKTVKESDHNTLMIEIDINWKTKISEQENRLEIFNFKQVDDFNKFINISNENDVLKSLFNDENEDLEKESQKWLKSVNKMIYASFSKIRLKRGQINAVLENLFQKKEHLKYNISIAESNNNYKKLDELSEELENVTEQVSQHCSEKNKQIVEDFIGDFDTGLEGFN